MPSAAQRALALIFVAAIMLTGPCLLSVAAVSAIRKVIFFSTSAHTEGSVIGLRQVPGSRGRSSYAPVFRFTGDDEHTYIVASNMATNPSEFRLGEQVKVLYQHGHPEHARIDSFLQLWLFELVTVTVGGAFSIVPMIGIMRRRRQTASEPAS